MDDTPDRADREAELIAAAASDDLSPAEAEEYAALAATDPTVPAEVAELRAVLSRLDDADLGGWDDAEPGPELQARVLAIPYREADPARTPVTTARAASARRWLPAAAAAVVLLLVGGVAGGWVAGREETPPSGPPGTLGAVEQIAFEGLPEGVDVDAALVAHTWGTETVLAMDGWTPGDRFRLVLVDLEGRAEDSGAFRGSEVEIDCRMNASLLREQVDQVEIRDADGTVVARSDVPEV